MTAFWTSRSLWFVCAIALFNAGCFFKEREAETFSGSGIRPQSVNRAPTISGTPRSSLRVGESYTFQPRASDPDGDTLTFSIQNRPAWATFDRSTGRLQGTPGAGDVNQFAGIRISVSDGRAQAALNFSIAVNQVALGSVTMSWTPPTTNADGSTITDLAGYRIYYGRSAGSLGELVVIDNVGITRWVIDNLSSATWYFSMSSFNRAGVESARSPVVSRTLS